MNQIFKDYDEIQRLINQIEEEWKEPQHFGRMLTGEEMATANTLVRKLREELINHGGVLPEQIVDANEIVFWYLDKEVSPSEWQYTFADCLAALLLDFDEPACVPANAKDRVYLDRMLRNLERKCLAVLSADLARIKEAKIAALTPLARLGKNHSAQQSERAKKRRSPLTGIIKSLVARYPGETVKELWPHLYSALDEEGLNPKEIVKQFDKWLYEYDFGDKGRRTITYGRFANIVSKLKSRLPG